MTATAVGYDVTRDERYLYAHLDTGDMRADILLLDDVTK